MSIALLSNIITDIEGRDLSATTKRITDFKKVMIRYSNDAIGTIKNIINSEREL